MKIGMIGLGRMGANMAERLIGEGHQVVGYARRKESVQRVADKGIMGAYSLEELTKKLAPPRTLWMMIPAGEPVDKTIEGLLPYLDKSDLLIDGGNSYYKDTMRRSDNLKERGIGYVDVGTSGGIWGLKEGYSMMIGGEKDEVERLRPLFETLAPSRDTGWGHVGPSGSGHFVKMVHNGIEYGLMQAYSEGFSILKHKEEFGLDLSQIAGIWRHGSVVRSWLLDLTFEALRENPELKGIAPYVEDSGEGRWTVFESIDLDVAAPIITLSLLSRFLSRDKENFSDKLLSAMRNKFGGHEIKHED